MKRIRKNKGIWKVIIGLVAILYTSCNEEFPKLLKEEYVNREFGSSLNKVLIVVVDGLRGNALQDIDPENLRKIARNSFYTNSSLGDYGANTFTRQMGLANIFTGVTSGKHKVANDLGTLDTDNYPTLFDRLKDNFDDFHIKGYTTDGDVNTYLFNGMDDSQVLSSDSDVLDKTKQALLEDSIELVVAHLSDIEKAGSSGSYESSDLAYRQAIVDFDGQILDLVQTLEERPNYKTENWLVVITSSVGGPIAYVDPNDATSYADSKRNTFTYFYSPKFTRKYVAKPNSADMPFEGSALRYTYAAPAVNATLTDASDYNFGNVTDDFTINFFIKSMKTDSYNYPIVLSKRATGFSGNGWNLFMQVVGGDNKLGWNSNISGQTFGTKRINDGLWHSFTVVVSRSGSSDQVRVFTDGEFNASNTVNTNSLSNTAPLVFGKKVGDENANPDLLLSNVQIYNAAFTDAEVADLAGIALVKDSHPKYGNLIGYWPGYDDVDTNKLTDLSGKNNHMTVTGGYSWTTFSDVVSQFKPDITASFYNIVPNQVDIPFFVYQWFGVLPSAGWSLDGQAWTPPYAVLEYE